MPITLTVELAKDAPRGAAVVLGVPLTASGPAIPSGVAVSATSLAARGFEGKLGQVLVVPGRSHSQVLIGIGTVNTISLDAVRQMGAAMVRASFGEHTISTAILDALPNVFDRAVAAQALVEGALLASYQFHTYKSTPNQRVLSKLVLTGRNGRAVSTGVSAAVLVAEAVALNRDLVNEPPATLNPQKFAEIAVAATAGSKQVAVTVWDEHDIERERLGGLRGVSLGSSQPPRLLKLVYTPKDATPKTPTLALVGKGITFDSGGLSLKPSDSMITMKSDMSGAGLVVSIMSVIGRLAPSCRVIGYACITENMPGPAAFKLGDILTARNGKTVEIHNTDAEGRLVLMDGLSLAAEDKPHAIVDIATLTGAQIVALGNDISAVMANDPQFCKTLLDSASFVGEELWELPLFPKYRKHLDSSIADMKNIGNPGQAGSIVAGLFLQEFVNGIPWAHLDIAGPSFTNIDEGLYTKGGTGAMVRTLLDVIKKFGSDSVRPVPPVRKR